MPTPAGFTALTASNIQDAAGNLLTGFIAIQPTDANDIPIPAVAGGSGGPIVAPASINFTTGVLAASAWVPDSALTTNPWTSYRFTFCSPIGIPLFVWKGVQPTGPTFNLDTYQPNVAAQSVIAPGLPGASAYQIAVANGFSGSQAAWLATLVGPVSGSQLAGYFKQLSLAIGNLIANATVTANTAVKTDGTLLSPISGYTTYTFAVYPGALIISNYQTGDSSSTTYGYHWLDITGAYISSTNGAAALATVTAPANACFCRVSFQNSVITAPLIVNHGSTLFQSLSQQVSAAGFLSNAQLESYAQGLNIDGNLVGPNNTTASTFIRFNGYVGSLSGFFAVQFAVRAGQQVVSNYATDLGDSTQYGFQWLDINGTYLSGTAGTAAGTPVTVPSGAAFGLVSFQNSAISAAVPLQINLGATVLPLEAVSLQTQLAAVRSVKRIFTFGDSISASFGVPWQTLIQKLTGAVIVGQDARGGRNITQIFENYANNPASGTGLGGVFTANGFTGLQTNSTPSATNAWATAGGTLASDLAAAAPDVILVYLGTNDAGPIGSGLGTLSDLYPAQTTYYGYWNWALRNISLACPSAKLMLVTPYINVDSGTSTAAIVAAIKAIAPLYAASVLDLTDSGIYGPLTVPGNYASGTTYAIGNTVIDGSLNPYISLVNSNTGHTPASSPTQWALIPCTYNNYLGGDWIHPYPAHGYTMLGRRIAAFLNQLT